jgi:uncharacterized protein YndB with AHSA1/START domain
MPDIQHAIQIAAKPEAIYPLVSTAKGFTRWWAQDVTEAPGAVELGFFKRNTVYRLKLTAGHPPFLAHWICETGKEWIDTRITFRLEARGAGTFVRFTHGGWQAETDYFTSCNTTWGELMFRLKAAAEGNPRGPLFLTDDLAY